MWENAVPSKVAESVGRSAFFFLTSPLLAPFYAHVWARGNEVSNLRGRIFVKDFFNSHCLKKPTTFGRTRARICACESACSGVFFCAFACSSVRVRMCEYVRLWDSEWLCTRRKWTAISTSKVPSTVLDTSSCECESSRWNGCFYFLYFMPLFTLNLPQDYKMISYFVQTHLEQNFYHF